MSASFFAADWHALTTEYEHPERIAQYTSEMILDWLGAGLDPKHCTFFCAIPCARTRRITSTTGYANAVKLARTRAELQRIAQ